MRSKGSVPVCATVPAPDRLEPMGGGSVHLRVPVGGCEVLLRRRPRRGFMLFEVQVAFVLLGIGLAGLCPLVVMQLRQVREIEKRMQGNVIATSRITGQSQPMVFMTDTSPPAVLPTPYYYIVPWKNPWAQKLAGSAQILPSFPAILGDTPPSVSAIPCDPGPLPVPSSVNPAYAVNVLTLDAPPDSQTVSVYVDVTTIP